MNLIALSLLLIVFGVGVVIALGLWLAGRRRQTDPAPTPLALPQLSDADRAEVERLLAQNQKIAAIKLAREQSGCGLREAKAYVEQIERGITPSEPLRPGPPPPSVPSAEPPAEQVRALLAQNQKIQAVKLVRQATGWGLREAKDYVDQLERSMRG